MTYEIFAPYKDKIIAFSTEREGYFENDTEGVSLGNYGKLNLCLYVNDEPKNVVLNRQLFCQYHNIEADHLFIPRQTHTANVANIAQTSNLEETDALISNISGTCIGINTADCLPLLIYDPRCHAAAAVHAGWRGVVGHIATNAILRMMQDYGSKPEDLLCAVGPAISAEAYEVGDELKTLFAEAGFPIEEIFIDRPEWGKSHLDLKSAIRYELIANDIKQSNIEISDICTLKNSQKYFSARHFGINSGRIFSGIILK